MAMFCEVANLHFPKQIWKYQMQEMDQQNFSSDDDVMYIFGNANQTFEVQKSNLTYAFMHLDNFA
jgi:hypothetical protein